jgi:uncharacterized protein DUF998
VRPHAEGVPTHAPEWQSERVNDSWSGDPGFSSRPVAVKTVVWCGALAGPIFVLAALIIGSFRDRYSQLRLPISLLAVGHNGWMQIVNFVVCGLSFLVLALGMRSILTGRSARWVPVLIAIVGVGLVGAGLFPADPGLGFPPHGQAEPGPTMHGHLHDVFSVAVFAGLPWTMIVLARYFRDRGAAGWARASMICGVVLAVGFAVILVSFNTGVWIADIAGLIQRLWVAIGFGFLSAVALHLLRDAAGNARVRS